MSSTTAAAPAASKTANPSVGTQVVLMSDIQVDPRNRKDHDKAKLQKLADDIKAEGLLQPIVIRPLHLGGVAAKYQIVAGERRFLAQKLLKLEKIEAKIIDVQDDELAAVVKQTVENISREDLNPIDKARQMRRLAELKMTQAEIGKLFGGLSQPTVANTLKLLDLPAEVQDLVLKGELEAAIAQELARFARWKKACVVMARAVVKQNNDEWEEKVSAKQLRSEVLPFERELVEAKLAVEIYVGDYSYDSRPKYKVSPELAKQPGFFKSGYSTYHYVFPEDGSPNLWEPERKKQDDARVAAAAREQQKKIEAKKSGKPTKEQKERAEKLEKNKNARLATSATLAHALRELREGDKLNTRALAVVCDFVLGSDVADLDEVKQALGIKTLPGALGRGLAGSGECNKDLEGVGAETMVKLAAAAILLHEASEALHYAGATPESCSYIAGDAKKAVANSIEVTVKAKGSEYRAKAGNAEASATSSAEHAAKAAAAKHFATNSAFIDLHEIQEGDNTGSEKWIFTAMKAGKGGK